MQLKDSASLWEVLASYLVDWSKWLPRLPVTEKIISSNLIFTVATFVKWVRSYQNSHQFNSNLTGDLCWSCLCKRNILLEMSGSKSQTEYPDKKTQVGRNCL